MHLFLANLKRRIQELDKIIHEKEESLRNVPDGTIHIFRSDRGKRFYLKQGDKRRYMKDSERHIAEKLCQKDYDQKVLSAAKRELKELERIYCNYEEKSCEAVYDKLHEERKKIVSPIWLPDEKFVKQWEMIEYEKKGFREDAPEFYTNKGERVRSKTEILIANALQKHQIPYRYEAPLKLKNYGLIHPDFTVLNVRLRKELYWEHMGKLDDEEYCDAALERIIGYEKNGIFPGDRLILTHETRKVPINSKIIEKVILHYLK